MRKRVLMTLAATLSLGAAAGGAEAHHSYAMFDSTKDLKLTGVVSGFGWTNPHSWIEVQVSNGKGGFDKWGVECTSPALLARAGWRSTTIRPGDQVTVTIHPLRSGEFGGSFVSVQLPDGRLMTDKSAPVPAPVEPKT